jgi:hypothetical protein
MQGKQNMILPISTTARVKKKWYMERQQQQGACIRTEHKPNDIIQTAGHTTDPNTNSHMISTPPLHSPLTASMVPVL